jgi:RimJ/RimL family protein N-acetyltransferase
LLRTERLLLRKPRLEDAHDLLEYVADPEVMRWIGGETGDLATTEEAIGRWLARWEENGIGHFSVEHEGRVVGRVGFLVWDAESWIVSSYAAGARPVTELGWTIAQRHWGNGYATEAARAIRSWAYTERDVQGLISLIHPDNARSIRVAQKLHAVPGETVSVEATPAVVWQHPR